MVSFNTPRRTFSLNVSVNEGGDPVISEHLGDVYLLMDDKSRALEHYEEALHLKHRPEEQPNLLEKLEDLRRELEVR